MKSLDTKSFVVLTVATLPVVWLLALWGMSAHTDVSVLWTPIAAKTSSSVFFFALVPFVIGGLCLISGIVGLSNKELRHSEVTWKYLLVTCGFIATGPLLGVIFQAQGADPRQWMSNPVVILPLTEIIFWLFAVVMTWKKLYSAYGSLADLEARIELGLIK